MDLLPIEFIHFFGHYVNVKDLKSLSAVNKRFRSILKDKIFEFPNFTKRLPIQVINDLEVKSIKSSNIRFLTLIFR